MIFFQKGFVAMLAVCLSVSGIQPAQVNQMKKTLLAAEETPIEDPTVTPAPEEPTPTPAVTILEVEVAQTPQTIEYGSEPDVKAFLLTVHFSDGSTQTVEPESISIDTSATGMRDANLAYQGFTAITQVQVIPRKPSGLHMTEGTTTSVKAAWELLPEASGYEIEVKDSPDGTWTPAGSTTLSTMAFTDLTQGVLRYIRVRSFSNDTVTSPEGEITSLTSVSEWTEDYAIAPKPDDMTGTATAGKITRTAVTLSWDSVIGATGYAVYYRKSTDTDFTRSGIIDGDTTYKVKGLKGGYDYYFQVIPYAGDESNPSAGSPEAFYGTAPSLPKLTVRGGDKTIRVNYTGGRAASALKLYVSEKKDGSYTLAHTFETPVSFKVCSVHKKLSNDKTYYVKMTAERTVADRFLTCECDPVKVKTGKASATSTKAKFYTTKKKFKASPAYKNYPDFKKLLNYKKSFILPGMVNTNAGGFESSTMVPQDMAIYGKYLLITAYDLKKKNDSVIYVLNKSDHKLKTLILLPHKGHVGGIACDGTYLWLAYGKKMQCLSCSVIDQAVSSGSAYTEVYDFVTTVSTDGTISYITYYKGRVWAGAYNELASTYVYVYEKSMSNGVPTLTRTGKMLMPDRTQGIAFTSKGKMILSRSCQTDGTQRGFMSCLDIYTPSIDLNATMKKGSKEKTIKMPPMNEGILIDGSYTYVLYESVAMSPPCKAPVDRVIAFKTSKLTKKAKK